MREIDIKKAQSDSDFIKSLPSQENNRLREINTSFSINNNNNNNNNNNKNIRDTIDETAQVPKSIYFFMAEKANNL